MASYLALVNESRGRDVPQVDRPFRDTQSMNGPNSGEIASGFTAVCWLRYFGLVRMVPFGSSKSLCVPAGADKRNGDSGPSANTRPTSTGTFPETTA
jgi:hypothetical protein